MNITITARKFKIRETLKEYIESEIENLSKHYDDIIDVEVILSFLNSKESIKIAEFIVKVPGTVLTATEETAEFEISVKACIEKLERQIEKIKTKKKFA